MILSHGIAAGNKAFSFVFSSNTNNVNLRTAALAAGWNGRAKVKATVLSGVTINGYPAMTINGDFPGGVELFINAGSAIAGWGAGINSGYSVPEGPGRPGYPGSVGISVSVAVKITNNGVIAGGGGSGGTGASANRPNLTVMSGGDGGLGGTYPGTGFSGGGAGSSYAGTYSGAGGAGGAPGEWGSAGSKGYSYRESGYVTHAGGAAGAAGSAVSGNLNVTWLATGTRIGPIA